MNLFKIFTYQLYLLQLENYELGRYFKLLFKKGLFPHGQQRKALVWTLKAQLLFLFAGLTYLGLIFLTIFYSYQNGLSVLGIVYYILCIFLIPLYFILYTLYIFLLWPFDFIAKQIIIAKAKKKISSLRNKIKIIGIAGSYGKTTTKQALAKVFGSKYKTLATPESVNTPVGISRWILKNLKDDTEIIIIEMGEHYKGDIKDICNIAKPDVAVITGINESHLERMGNIEVVASTILELADNSALGAKILFNADDKYINSQAEKLAKKYGLVSFYGYKNFLLTGFEFKDAKFNTDQLVWEYKIPSAGLKGQVALLGEYVLGLVVLCQQAVGYLNLDINVALALQNLKPVEHRLQPIKSGGDILVIDDAYNGNPDGVAEAIKVLSRFIDRRKVFITPGLVEMGEASADAHRLIGNKLASVADVVVLIKNSVTGYIEAGIKSARGGSASGGSYELGGKTAPQIIWFNSAQEAHASLGKILKPKDVVVFQNDWGDNYL